MIRFQRRKKLDQVGTPSTVWEYQDALFHFGKTQGLSVGSSQEARSCAQVQAGVVTVEEQPMIT